VGGSRLSPPSAIYSIMRREQAEPWSRPPVPVISTPTVARVTFLRQTDLRPGLRPMSLQKPACAGISSFPAHEVGCMRMGVSGADGAGPARTLAYPSGRQAGTQQQPIYSTRAQSSRRSGDSLVTQTPRPPRGTRASQPRLSYPPSSLAAANLSLACRWPKISLKKISS